MGKKEKTVGMDKMEYGEEGREASYSNEAAAIARLVRRERNARGQ